MNRDRELADCYANTANFEVKRAATRQQIEGNWYLLESAGLRFIEELGDLEREHFRKDGYTATRVSIFREV